MAQTWENSKLNPVWYSLGKFTGNQSLKAVKAPFNVVQINGAVYLEPVSFGGGLASFGQGVAADLEQARFQRTMWYTDLGEQVVLGEHEMGDSSDNWKGMFKIGQV